MPIVDDTDKKSRIAELTKELLKLSNEVVKEETMAGLESEETIDPFSDIPDSLDVLDDHNDKYNKLLEEVMTDDQLQETEDRITMAEENKGDSKEWVELSVGILKIAKTVFLGPGTAVIG